MWPIARKEMISKTAVFSRKRIGTVSIQRVSARLFFETSDSDWKNIFDIKLYYIVSNVGRVMKMISGTGESFEESETK